LQLCTCLSGAQMKKVFYLLLFLSISINVFANDLDKSDSLIVQAIRADEKIKIDGILSETIWENGYEISKFTQREPIEGSQPTEKTEVRIAYDDNSLYVGARMFDSAPDSIIARLARRDAEVSTDYFAFFIDPFYDKRSGFYFAVTAAGSVWDGVLMNDDWDDDSWDGVWDVKTNIDEKGWTAEFRIPYSQLRFHKKNEYLWSINFKREIHRKNESDYLVFTPKDGSGFVSRFVDLVGIENIEPIRQIELLPYFRTKAEYTNPTPGNPFNDGSRYLPGMGVDVKIGIGNNLTLDATVNPDFGQVEVDPAVVNLSDIETYYQEKRPFFIEGSSTFSFGHGGARNYWGFNWSNPDFFYSRRIGRAPQGSLPPDYDPDYDFVDSPEGTRILGAAKLSGKVGNNWNVGTLHAVTAREKAELQMGGKKFHSEVEPLTYYGIYRAQREINESRQAIGFISTVMNRKFADDRLREELNSDAYTIGIDGWTFLDSSKTWVISGWTGMTHVRANQTRMIDLQTNSQHYFQRPDAGHVSVDSSTTSMTGYAARFCLNKQKGNAIFNSAFGFINPKFDVNDVGFMWRGDQINGHIGAGYQWVKPGKFTREVVTILAIFGSWDFDKNAIWNGYFQNSWIEFLNYYELEYMLAYNPETINNRRTRGGPLTINPPGWEANIFMNSDDRKPWVFGLGTFGYKSESGSWNRGVELEVEWKPAANVSVSVGPELEYDHTDAQWIDAFDDPLATKTYGKRYVFAELDHRTLSASIRLNWTFTPKLSFQLYAQPLISSGDYYNFKELARPKSYEFSIYGEGESTFNEQDYLADPDGSGLAESIELGNPDFNYKSLRGNAIFRWEYSPGSTLYFVWTQRRSDFEEIGEFRFRRSMSRLWNVQGDNIFMVKMTYWFGI